MVITKKKETKKPVKTRTVHIHATKQNKQMILKKANFLSYDEYFDFCCLPASKLACDELAL
jgi:hypothetical protein